jgi:hypothetical protein
LLVLLGAHPILHISRIRVNVEFLADRIPLGRYFLKVRLFFLVDIFPPVLHTHIFKATTDENKQVKFWTLATRAMSFMNTGSTKKEVSLLLTLKGYRSSFGCLDAITA